MRGMDWERLRGERVLATNAAAFLLPPGVAEWSVFGDVPFLRAFRPQLRGYVEGGGNLVNATGRPLDDKNYWMLHPRRLNGTKNWGVDLDGSRVRWNRSTGGCAIHLAVLMGARELVLLGYDMRVGNSREHNFHSEYDSHYRTDKNPTPMPKPVDNHYRSHFLKPFPRIAEDLKGLGVKCLNANCDSELRLFPFCDLDEVLTDGHMDNGQGRGGQDNAGEQAGKLLQQGRVGTGR